MGRFTIFAIDDCPHCQRTKATFGQYSIPYTEISLSKYPHRRSDMLSASDALTVPQVFLNETYVGGADEAIALLTGWSTDEDWTPLQQYENFVATAPDPRDPRLHPSADVNDNANGLVPQPPSSGSPTSGGGGSPTGIRDIPHGLSVSGDIFQGRGPLKGSTIMSTSYDAGPPPIRDKIHVVATPDDDKLMTILEMTELLKSILPSRDLRYNLTVYKQSFKASELIDALMGVFDFKDRNAAVEYGRDVLQAKHQLLNHVVDDHPLRDTPSLFFRLTCYQRPQILNSYRLKWTERVDLDPLRLLNTLKAQLYEILKTHTSERTGKVNYIAAYKDQRFPTFEEASCELFGIDIGNMKEKIKLAFCINLYNLMIKYAFCKVGIGNTDTARYSFFNNVQFQVGPHVFSFQDLENGILRGNRKAPYALKEQFGRNDIRAALICKEVDNRVHFALNCGAASCPPIKTFTARDIEQELRIVAMAFCDENIVLSKASNNRNDIEVILSKIFSWYSEDFGSNSHEMLQELCHLSRGKKQLELQSLLSLGITPRIKYAPYDWSTDACAYIPFSGGTVKAKASRFLP